MRYFVSLLGLMLLVACASSPAPVFSCPVTGLAPEAGAIPVLNADQTDMAVYAGLKGYQGSCSPATGGLSVELALNFFGSQGPAGADITTHDFPYFIALLAPDETVLHRQAFSTSVSFDNTGKGVQQEEHRIHVPMADIAQGRQYKIVYGFALTPAQLAYNKKKRARKNE